MPRRRFMFACEELTANKWQPQQWQPLGLKLGTQVHLWNLLTKVYRCWGVDHFILKLIFKGLQNLKKGEIIGNCSNPNKQRNVAAYFIIHYSIRNIKARELQGRPWSPAQADGWHFYTFIQLNAPFYWTNVGTIL